MVIAVLSLGLAGNAAIFSLFKGLALKPLPGVRDSATSSVLLGRTIDGRGIGVSVMGAALIASFFPAWKASRTDPLTALRHR